MKIVSARSPGPPRGPLTGVLAFLAVVLAIANILLLASREPVGGVLRAHRDEDAFRLAGLTARSHPHTEADGAVQVTFTFGDRCGSPLGLALIGQIGRLNQPVEAETQLWFSLAPSSVPPRRPADAPLPAVTVTRQDLVSDLVAPGAAPRLELEISDLGTSKPAAQWSLFIDNLQEPEGRSSATAPAASLDRMVRGGHCNFRDRDLATFALLARILRARICDDLTQAGSRCYDSALTIFRDVLPDTYRIDLRTLGQDHGLLHFGLEILRDASGHPAQAVYRVQPHSTLAKSANLFFTHPRPRGELLLSSDPGFDGLRYLPALTPEQLLDRRVDLAMLLEDLPATERLP